MAAEDVTLKLVLLGEDKSAGKSLSGLGVAAGLAFAAAGAAALKFGADSIAAFMEADREQAKLEDAYSRFPALADGNIVALRALNEEIQRKVGADADDIAGAQAVLAQYELNETQLRTMTPLLVDYATKTGKDLPTAAGLLGKALMGNARALKDLGIDFKATGDRGADFDAIVGLLDQKVGGYADSIPEVEKKQKILAASFGDLQESVGERLLPVIIDLVDRGQGLVDWASDNADVLIPLVTTAGLAAAAIGTVTLAAKGVEAAKGAAATIRGLGAAMDGLTIKSRAAAIAAGWVGITLAAGAAVYQAFANRQSKITAAQEDFAAALEASNGALDENVRKTAAKRLMDEGAFAAAERLGIGVDTVTDAAMGNAVALELVRSRLAEVRSAEADAIGSGSSMDLSLRDNEQSAGALETALGIVSTGLDEATTKQRQMDTATRSATSAAKDNEAAAESNADAQKDLSAALVDVYRQTLALRGDTRSLEAAYDDATAAAKKNGRTLDENTAAGRANQDALDRIASAALSVKSGMEEAGKSTKDINGEMDRARSKFISSATSMGMSKKAAKELADDLGLVSSKAKKAGDAVKAIPTKKTVNVLIKVGGDKGIKTVYSAGGGVKFSAYDKGGRPKVGELALFHADELWVPDTAGTVLTKRQTANFIGSGPSPIASAGGTTIVQEGDTIHIDVRGVLTEGEAGRAIDRALTSHKRRVRRLDFEGVR